MKKLTLQQPDGMPLQLHFNALQYEWTDSTNSLYLIHELSTIMARGQNYTCEAPRTFMSTGAAAPIWSRRLWLLVSSRHCYSSAASRSFHWYKSAYIGCPFFSSFLFVFIFVRSERRSPLFTSSFLFIYYVLFHLTDTFRLRSVCGH